MNKNMLEGDFLMQMEENGPEADVCVYAIVNEITSKAYVGSTTRRLARWKDHERMLVQKRHHAPKLQASYNKHGPEAFSFVVLYHECPKEDLGHWEQCFLEEGDCYENGYNTLEFVDGTDPTTQSRRVHEKWSNQKQRVNHSQKIKQKWAAGNYANRTVSPEFITYWRDQRRKKGRPRVLVMCHANRWRSVMCKLYLKKLAPEFKVGSSGFKEAGKRAAKPIREYARSVGLVADQHISGVITPTELEWYDYVIIMDGGNRRRLDEVLPQCSYKPVILMLGDFHKPPLTRIKDPAFTRKHSTEFMEIMETIEVSTTHLVVSLIHQASHNLAKKLIAG